MNLLDTWDVVTPDAGGLAFDMGTAMAQTPLMHWGLDFAPDVVEARQQLQPHTLAVAQTAAVLQTLPTQFAQLAQTPPTEAVSFSTEVGPENPQQEFWGLLQAAQNQDAVARGNVQFSLGDNGLMATAEQALQQFQQEAQKVLDLVSYLAWVETRVAGELLGHTVMGWGSDARTYWATTAPAQYIALHEQTLATALNARYVVLRRLSLVLQGATLFSTLLSGQVWLAVPMLWQYVNRIVAEFQTAAAA